LNKLDFHKKHFKTDLSSGLVVFLIALPLCLGISLASGAPLFAGIISGILGGIVVGFLSNSQVNVSGPAASVALVILTAITTLGSYEAVLFAVILAGIVQIAMGFIGAGTIAYYFPSSMIKGILASIGLILILKQIPHSVGYNKVFVGSESFRQADGHNTLSELFYMLNDLSPGVILITLISLAIIILWDRPSLKQRFAFFRFFPAALAAVIVAIGINEIYNSYFPHLALNANQLVTLPVARSAGEFLSFFTFPKFDQIFNIDVYFVALSIAFIASLESLLSTEAGDKLDPYKRRTSTNTELKAQGIGNIISGFIGGLPITAVIVRTSANISSGARTKTSTIVHGVIMLFCALLIPHLLNKIPLAALSAVLFVVGYKLTSFTLYKDMYKQGRRQYAPFIVTIVAVLFTDLITGILVGAGVSIFIILRDNYNTPFFHDTEPEPENDKKKCFILSEEVTFLNKAVILKTLSNVEENSTVIIDATRSVNIDDDVLEIFKEFKATCGLKNIRLETRGLEKFYA
jgi:MFS superfamily sulfate permease-like transporter